MCCLHHTVNTYQFLGKIWVAEESGDGREHDILIKVLVARSCLSLFDPMDCSPLGFSVHGILQARILEWISIPFSRESS